MKKINHSNMKYVIDHLPLKNHIAIVLERKKPYNCDICDVRFALNSDLKKHITSIHEQNKPKCSICDAIFSSKANLKAHISSVHEKNKLFKCELCDTNFTLKASLNRHNKIKCTNVTKGIISVVRLYLKKVNLEWQ